MIKRNVIYIVLFALTLFVNCSDYTYSTERKAVFNAIMDFHIKLGVKNIVLKEYSVIPRLGIDKLNKFSLMERLPNISDDLANDFVKNNAVPIYLRDSIKSSKYLKWVSEAYYKDIALNHKWVSFYEKYQDAKGLCSFSNIGISEDRCTAMIYIEINCGMLCGEGNIIMLKKGKGNWSVSDIKQQWIS